MMMTMMTTSSINIFLNKFLAVTSFQTLEVLDFSEAVVAVAAAVAIAGRHTGAAAILGPIHNRIILPDTNNNRRIRIFCLRRKWKGKEM